MRDSISVIWGGRGWKGEMGIGWESDQSCTAHFVQFDSYEDDMGF